MAPPIVSIVGRPNVGKSSLLNMLARNRISIVDPRAGITRDRVAITIGHEDRHFELVDTGGIGLVDDDQLETHVESQIQYAIARADLILLVVDARSGPHPADAMIADRLRKLDRPILAVANKVDDPKHASEAAGFLRLGFGDPLPVSALHGSGRQELLDTILKRLGPLAEAAPQTPVMKLAIVGKRNAGKSTFVNALAGEERCIVSEIPGTTRDAVDVRFEKDGRVFVAIDTAGVRKKRSMSDIDFYSHTRALTSIRRADVVLHLIDALVPISEPDVRLAQAVVDEHKPLVLAINKWDLAADQATPKQFAEYVSETMPVAPYAPLILITAKTGRNVGAAVDLAIHLHKQASTRVTTSQLNDALEQILALRGPSPKRGTKPVKVYYGTQVSVAPPTIALFCNDPELVTTNYRRFMENRMRELLPFREVPIRLLFRARRRERLTPSR